MKQYGQREKHPGQALRDDRGSGDGKRERKRMTRYLVVLYVELPFNSEACLEPRLNSSAVHAGEWIMNLVFLLVEGQSSGC